jgi:hypothetical protein
VVWRLVVCSTPAPSVLPFEETRSAAKMYHRCLRCDYQVPLASRRLQGYEPMDSLEKGLVAAVARERRSSAESPRGELGHGTGSISRPYRLRDQQLALPP